MSFFLKHLALGTYFGFILVKTEAASWYRMQEMFRFQSFYMYGLFMGAIAVGAFSIFLIKRFRLRAIDGAPIRIVPHPRGFWRYALGGLTFGVGWGFTGLCPGPIAAVIGAGFFIIVVVLLSAMAGTWAYVMIQRRLPQ